jgi:hypothetical protein
MIEILHGLAVAKLANPLAYKLEVLPEGMKQSKFGKRDLEGLVKPIYDRLAARAAAEGGDDAAPGQRDQVHEIGLACGLFCDADREGYATSWLGTARPARSDRRAFGNMSSPSSSADMGGWLREQRSARGSKR